MNIFKYLKTFLYSATFIFLFFDAFAATETILYSYDENNQLNRVAYSDGTTVNYSFDLLGNRFTKTVTLADSPANHPPDIPVDSLPSADSVNVSTDSNLEWTNTDPDTGDVVIYYVYFGESPDPSLVYITDKPTFDPGPLNSLTTYYWKVVAVDNRNDFVGTSVQKFTTKNDPPETPRVLYPEDESISIAGIIELGWEGDDPNVTDTVSYDLYFGTSDTPPLVETHLSETNYKTQTLNPNTTYYWKIIARDNHGAETPGPVWSVKTLNTTATLLNNMTYTSNAVLTKQGGPYLVTGNLTINQGATLTIEPGTIIKMSQNSLLNVYGALKAQGTADDKVIFTSYANDQYGGDCNGDGNASSPAPGDWYGIRFNDTTEDSSTVLENCIIEYAGYGSQGAVNIYYSSPVVKNNLFARNSNYDLYATYSNAVVTGNTFNNGIYSSGGLMGIENNIIHYNDSYPIQVDGDTTGKILINNTIDNINPDSVLQVLGGTITKDTVWPNIIKYKILSSITVRGADGADGVTTLTIDPGARILFDPHTQLNIGYSSGNPGALSARGTEAQKIVFTSSKATPAPGDWYGIRFDNTTDDGSTILENCIVEYAGYSQGAVNIYYSSPAVKNNLFARNSNYDLYATYSNAVVTGNTFNNGIYSSGGLMGIENNIIHYNDSYPIQVDGDTTGKILINNTIDNINPDSVLQVLGGTITKDTVWPNIIKYKILSSITVRGADGADGVTTLTIDPGARILFDQYGKLSIGGSSGNPGALSARGTEAQKIVFTSSKATPAPGDWYGIRFDNTTDDGLTLLENCIIEYAGYGSQGAVYIYYANIPVKNSIVRTNQSYGIYINNSSPTITGNSISGNTGYGVYNATATVIKAENNWWGHASGPYHPTDNPSGQGDRVSNNVDFTPWMILQAGVDTDADGISDDWEIARFGNLTTANDFTDYDADGYSDLREFLSGSDPKNKLSIPGIMVDPDGDMDTDGLDLDIMIFELGRDDCTIQNPCIYDLDQDGDVDTMDLKLFGEDFGRP